MRRPTPRPTSPMTRRREWLPQPGIGRQPAHKMLGWQHFGKHEITATKEGRFDGQRELATSPHKANLPKMTCQSGHRSQVEDSTTMGC